MYFPIGSTRLYASEHEGREPIVFMARSPDGQWLATLTASSLCVWSARQHRLVLGHYPRHPTSLESDGPNVRLCWHPDSHMLAISTSGSFVYLYQVQEANGGSGGDQHPSSRLSVEDCARLLHGQFHVSISLTQKVQAVVQEGAATGALAASNTHFWLGVAQGVLLAIDWSAQDPTPHKLYLRPPQAEHGGSQASGSAAVTAVCCSPELGLVAGLDAEGRAGYSFTVETSSRRAATNAESLLLPSESGTALAINVSQRLLCVGCASGALLLFHIDFPERRQSATRVHDELEQPVPITLRRKLSLSPWGIGSDECGAVIAVDWSDDGLGLAALWKHRSRPGIWSARSGACTFVPPASDYSSGGFSMRQQRDAMPCALAWAENGLALWTAVMVRSDTGNDSNRLDGQMGAAGGLLAEVMLVQPCASRGPCQNEAARRCFYTHDRVLVLTQHNVVATQSQPPLMRDQSGSITKAVSAVNTQFVWRELAVPWKYLADNWPVRHVSISADGTQLAVSGARGLTLLDLRTKRWRVFGDVSQERELDCIGLAWFRHIVLVYAVAEQSPVQEHIRRDSNQQERHSHRPVQLHLYPRKHLDRSSRLFSPASLPAPPHCVDVDEHTGVLATLCADGSLILHQLWLQNHDDGQSDANYREGYQPSERDHFNSEAMALRAVTVLVECCLEWAVSSHLGDLSVHKLRLAPGALVFPCSMLLDSTLSDGTSEVASDGIFVDDIAPMRVAAAARRARAKAVQGGNAAAAEITSLCLLLFRDGQLQLFDAKSGARLRLATNVADFWLTPASSLPFQDVTALPLLWYSDNVGRLHVCRAGDLAKDWAAVIAAHQAAHQAVPACASATVVHCWGDKQDASEAWTVGLSEYYGVLLQVSAPHWSSGGVDGRDRQTTSLLGYGDQFSGLVINQSPVLHRLFESLLNSSWDDDEVLETEAARVTTSAGYAACAAICQRCSPAWPSLAVSLEWLLHRALENAGTKVSVPVTKDASKYPYAAADDGGTVLSRVLEVLRCFPREYEGIVGRCARTMDPGYWVPLFQEPPYGAGQPSILFEACLRHQPPQLRNAAHYLVILQTMPVSSASTSKLEKWEDYPLRLVQLALAAGEYALVREIVQFLRRAEVYASAAAESSPEVTHASSSSRPSRRSAFGRVPAVNQEDHVPAPSAAVAETAGRKVGWLEFLGLVDSSASDSDSASTSRSIQPAEVETRMQQVAGMDQLDGTVASCKETASRRDSIVQTEIVPLVEAHWLDLLQELRLSELVRCVDAVREADGGATQSADSEFQLGPWLRRLHRDRAGNVEVVEDFGISLHKVATMMYRDRQRQAELAYAQQVGNDVVDAAGDSDEEVLGGPRIAGGAARVAPDHKIVRELGHDLAAAGWVDLGLLLPTVCGDADGVAGILRASAPHGYGRYDAYASGLLRFALESRQAHTDASTSTAGFATAGGVATAEAERQVMTFLERLTAGSLPKTGGEGGASASPRSRQGGAPYA